MNTEFSNHTNNRIDALFTPGHPAVSFEFFPPRDEAGEAQLMQAIGELKPLRPHFISVTRTGGGTGKTVDLTERIQNELGFCAMSHLTCAGHTREEIGDFLDDLWRNSVRNVLALRGDPPPGQTMFQATDGGFEYASDLTEFVRARHDFCIGVAGYPETHPQSLNAVRDARYLKQKIDAGGNFVITQLFFNNDDFYRWRDNVRGLGVDVPIVAGIMPILGVSQIKRFVGMCGAKIPEPLLQRLETLEADPLAVHAAGVEYSIRQCEDLMANGVDGLHFYTLNRSKATVLICQALGLKNLAS